jgi:tetratricopeptide (TPR) repeat protein
MFSAMIGAFVVNILSSFVFKWLSINEKGSEEALKRAILEASEKALNRFYDKYGDKYGNPEQSFLAQPKNWDMLLNCLSYPSDSFSQIGLTSKGLTENIDADEKAIQFFLACFEEEVRINNTLQNRYYIKTGYFEAKKHHTLQSAEHQDLLDKLDITNQTQSGAIQDLKNHITTLFTQSPSLQSAADTESRPNPVEEAINQTIDSYRDIIQTSTETALKLLEELKKKRGDTLSDHCRFRIITNIGACKLAAGNTKQSAYDFIEAFKYAENDPKAWANRILAAVILKSYRQAKSFFEDASLRFPEDPNIYQMRLILAQHELVGDDPLLLVPASLRENGDISGQLAELYLRQNDYENALRWGQKAYDINPQSFQIREVYVRTLIEPILNENSKIFFLGSKIPEDKLSQLLEAKELLITLRSEEIASIFLPCSCNLVLIERLFGNYDEALDIIENALLRFKEDHELLQQKAFILYDLQRFQESAEVLGSLPDDIFEDKSLMEVDALSHSGKIDEALSKLKKYIDQPYKHSREEVRNLHTLLTHQKGDLEEAIKLNKEYAEDYPGELSHRILDIELRLRVTPVEKLITEIAEVEQLVESSNLDYMLKVAGLYFSIRDYPDALKIYRRIVGFHRDSIYLKNMFICLLELDKRSEVNTLLNGIDEKLKSNPFYLKVATDLHIRTGHLASAQNYLEKYIKKSPQDFHSILMLLLLQDRQGRKNEVRKKIEKTTYPECASLSDKVTYIKLLKKYDYVEQSLDLSYACYRKHQNSPEAHLVLQGQLLFNESSNDNLNSQSVINEDSSFTVSIDGQSKSYIIETGNDCGLLEEEIAPDHQICLDALGKKISDEILIYSDQYRKVIGIVQKIEHKYIYALNKSLKEFNLRFPNNKDLMMVPIQKSSDDIFDFQPIFDSLSNRHSRVLKVEELYKDNTLPLAFVANLLGAHPFDTLEGMMNNQRVKLLCSTGQINERQAALHKVSNYKKGVVLDPTTLYLMHVSDSQETLLRSIKEVCIVRSTIDLLQELADERKSRSDHSEEFLYFDGKQYCRQEFTPEELQRSSDFINGIIAWAESKCTIIPAVGSKDFSEEASRIFSHMHPAYADSILAADGLNLLLLSDDLHYRNIAYSLHGVDSVWSQILLLKSIEKRQISIEQYVDAVLFYVKSNFSYIFYDATILDYVCSRDKGTARNDFDLLNGKVSAPETSLSSAFMVALEFLFVFWTHSGWSYSDQRKVTNSIIAALSDRDDASAEKIVSALRIGFYKYMFRLIQDVGPHPFFDVLAEWERGHFLISNGS